MHWLPPSGSDTFVVEQTTYRRACRSLTFLYALAIVISIMSSTASIKSAAAYIATILLIRRIFEPFRKRDVTQLDRQEWHRYFARACLASARLGAAGTALLVASLFADFPILVELGITGIFTAVLVPLASVHFLHRLMEDRATVLIHDRSIWAVLLA